MRLARPCLPETTQCKQTLQSSMSLHGRVCELNGCNMHSRCLFSSFNVYHNVNAFTDRSFYFACRGGCEVL